MSRRLWLIGPAILLTATAAFAAWTLMPRDYSPGDPGDAEQVAIGEALYEWNCARCHGADMSGELGWIAKETGLSDDDLKEVTQTLDDVAPAHDASGDTSRHDDQMLFQIISEGPAKALAKPDTRMPRFDDRLQAREIWAIIAFMKSQWTPAEVTRAEPESN